MINFRCTRCILPNTFPKIYFDEFGECIYCQLNLGVPKRKPNVLPKELLNSKRILVGLSGGRDSSYGLLWLREHFNGEIITFTYEWPLVNVLARKNASRLVSYLGIEHIIRAPKTFDQLKYIRRIVKAIGFKPNLKTIPLLLAPDKYFFIEAQKIAGKYNCSAIIFCSGNELEFTDFKSRAMGAKISKNEEMLKTTWVSAISMATNLLFTYILNPRLFLAGIKIPIQTFFITYLFKRKIYYLYDFVNWDEKIIEDKLKNLWESPKKNLRLSNWRAGDGTSEFYNYLYRSLMGFDERTCNLANQVRSGILDRETALKFDKEFLAPDYFQLQQYASLVGFNLDEFLYIWNNKLRKNEI